MTGRRAGTRSDSTRSSFPAAPRSTSVAFLGSIP